MHFIPSLLTDGKAAKFCMYVCCILQVSRRNATLLILPAATDLAFFLFHLFMNTVITVGRSWLSEHWSLYQFRC